MHDAIEVDEVDMPASPERVWRASLDSGHAREG